MLFNYECPECGYTEETFKPITRRTPKCCPECGECNLTVFIYSWCFNKTREMLEIKRDGKVSKPSTYYNND